MLTTDVVKLFDRRCAVLGLIAVLLLGCASPTQRGDAAARRAGFVRTIVEGTTFRHLVYAREDRSSATISVYLEGDGLPWIGGRVPATDPTSRDPLALQLMIRSTGPAMYVGRPCYHELSDASCSAQSWTFARYSSATVDSMAKAIETQTRALGASDVRLVGYSGGGVLAVLIAERLQNVASVVTIAANLDVDAWAAHHGYLPLQDSLNPARSSHDHPWREIHLHGAHDTNVPIATTRAYFDRYPAARQITFEEYDHVCCWVEDWAAIDLRTEAAAIKDLEKSL